MTQHHHLLRSAALVVGGLVGALSAGSAIAQAAAPAPAAPASAAWGTAPSTDAAREALAKKEGDVDQAKVLRETLSAADRQYSLLKAGKHAVTYDLTYSYIGQQLIDATFTPTAGGDYESVVTQVAITVLPGTQTITFGAVPADWGSRSGFSVGGLAIATNGLPVAFSGSGACTVTPGGDVTVTGVGTCTLTAAQAGNADYQAAAPVVQVVSVVVGPVEEELEKVRGMVLEEAAWQARLAEGSGSHLEPPFPPGRILRMIHDLAVHDLRSGLIGTETVSNVSNVALILAGLPVPAELREEQ